MLEAVLLKARIDELLADVRDVRDVADDRKRDASVLDDEVVLDPGFDVEAVIDVVVVRAEDVRREDRPLGLEEERVVEGDAGVQLGRVEVLAIGIDVAVDAAVDGEAPQCPLHAAERADYLEAADR